MKKQERVTEEGLVVDGGDGGGGVVKVGLAGELCRHERGIGEHGWELGVVIGEHRWELGVVKVGLAG